MDSEYYHENYYLNDILKLETSLDYKNIVDTVNKKIQVYFQKEYKTIGFEVFVESNDYYIKKIKFFIEMIKKTKNLDINTYGQIIQNFILSLEKPIKMTKENKMIKTSIESLNSFLLINKQQLSLINQIEIIEKKSKEIFDYLLLLEKLCVLTKEVFDLSSKKIKNNKLHQRVTKFLIDDKYLREKMTKTIRNNRISVNTISGANFYSIFPKNSLKLLNKPITQNQIFYRAITQEKESEKNDDIQNIYEPLNENIIFPIEVVDLPENKNKTELFLTSDPVEPKNYQLLFSDASSVVGQSNRLSLAEDYKSSKYLDFEKPHIYSSFHQSDPNEFSLKILNKNFNFDEIKINLLDNYIKNNKKIRRINGDIIPLQDFDENIFSEFIISPKIFKPRIINELKITNDILNINSDRSPTPEIEKQEKETKETSIIKRSSSRELPIFKNIIVESPKKSFKQINYNTNFKFNNNLNQTDKLKIYSDNSSTIKLPPDYFTYDPDLKLLCDLINQTTNTGWKKVIDDKNLKIHKKTIEGFPQIMIKTVAILDGSTKEEIFEAISNVNIRMQWDKIFSEFRVVETNPNEGWEILYMSIKSPSVFVDDRDFVQKRKIWKDFPNENSTILHFKSVDHKMCPPKKKVIRAETIISGYYIQTLDINPPKTLVSIISQTDIKGVIPNWLVNSVAQKAPKEWVNNLMRGCDKVRSCSKK